MQPISECLPQTACVPTSSLPSAETPKLPAPTTIRVLWLRMAEIYGQKWTRDYGDNPDDGAGQTWAKGLAGVTPPQMARGLSACIASSDPWPPTLPEFRAKCLGIPSFASVRLDAAKESPFTILVWQHLDGYRYKQASSDSGDRLLREAYELAREFVMLGGELPVVAEKIEQEKREVNLASPESVQAHIAGLREITEPRLGKMAAAGDDT